MRRTPMRERRQQMEPILISSSHTHAPGGGEGARVHLMSPEQRAKVTQLQQQEAQDRLLARAQKKRTELTRPHGYERPTFNSPQYWRDCARGWISDDQQRDDQADYEHRRRRALDSKHNRAPAPHRHLRPAPRPSNQYAKPMATQAARDDRLTPQSKALLQVIVARTGKGRYTDSTKTTLGKIMSRCPRSIQRYLGELVRFGYIRTQTIKSRCTGFYVGLRIWIMNSVLPAYTRKNANYDPEKWVDLVGARRIREETKESLTKVKDSILYTLGHERPPWFSEFVFRAEHAAT